MLQFHQQNLIDMNAYLQGAGGCPMVNQAVPGAPKNGFWIQFQGPLRNPYFGADMLECGTEVKQ